MNENPYAYFDDFDYPTDMPSDGILSRTILDTSSVRFVVFFFAAGQELSEHTAASPAVLHVISGEARLELGEDAKDAHPGTVVYMTAGLHHAIFAKTPVVMLLQLLKYPPTVARQSVTTA